MVPECDIKDCHDEAYVTVTRLITYHLCEKHTEERLPEIAARMREEPSDD